MRTRFILINTSHAGNVGAAARAMKVMGFDDLVLVAPRWANVLRREETIQRASGALDVLERARIVPTLDDALEGMHHLCATAMTARDFGPPTMAPRACLARLAERLRAGPDVATDGSTQSRGGPLRDAQGCDQGVAFLFGSERFGMRNEDVYRCHVALSIPTDPRFGSLNLAAALQVIAYEWRQALGGFPLPNALAPAPRGPVVGASDAPDAPEVQEVSEVSEVPDARDTRDAPEVRGVSEVQGKSDANDASDAASASGGSGGSGALHAGAASEAGAAAARQALSADGLAIPGAADVPARPAQAADAAQVAGLLAHWEQALTAIDYLDPRAPKKLMPRLNQLFNRAGVTVEEVHILRGVAKAMLQAAARERR